MVAAYRYLKRSSSTGLACLLSLALAAPRPLAAEPPLRIVVIEGEGALNDIASGRAYAPRIRVEDRSGHPISGAKVEFALPDLGPGGVFDTGGLSLAVASNDDGIAACRGLRPNNVAGPFQIHVSASHSGSVANAFIRQTNVATRRAEAGHKGRLTAVLVGVAVGAGLATAAIALRGAGNTQPSGPPVLVPVAVRIPPPTRRTLMLWDEEMPALDIGTELTETPEW